MITLKKNIGLISFLIILFVVLNINTTNGLEKNSINFTNLNSNNFLKFLEEKNISSTISKICTTDYCDYAKGKNNAESLNIFKNNYEEYLINNGYSEIARSTILKGFPITSINVLD